MDQALIQRTRYLIRAKFRRVQSCPDTMIIHGCRQLLDWIYNHPLLKYMYIELKEYEKYENLINEIIKGSIESQHRYTPPAYDIRKIIEHTAICYFIIKGISELNPTEERWEFVIRCIAEYLNRNDNIKFDEAVTVIKDIAIDGLFEYFDEQLDERNAIYGLLGKYKQLVEWFRYNKLRNFAENGNEGRDGEKALAYDVQEYLLDQGVEFFIEPSTASGEPDLVLRTAEGRYLLIDAKYIKDNHDLKIIKTKIASGFNQVAKYCNDYNEQSGFLVVFNANSIGIGNDFDVVDGFPFVKIDNKLIYYICIDISNSPSASKIGKAKGLEIYKRDMITDV